MANGYDFSGVTSADRSFMDVFGMGNQDVYSNWLQSQGINPADYKGYSPEQQSALTDSFKNLQDVNDPSVSSKMSGDLTGYQALQGGLGIGQLGLGLAGYLDNRKTAGKQRELMDQQLASNRYIMSQAKQKQADVNKVFGSGGLASQSVQRG